MSLAPLLAPLIFRLGALDEEALPKDLTAGLAAFLAYLLSLITFAMVFALSIASHVGAADGVLRTGERHHGKRRGFHGQRGQILGFQAVHVGLAARARQHLRLDGEG